MEEISFQGLFKVITGHSTLKDPEHFLEEINHAKKRFTEGLHYYKEASSRSRSELDDCKELSGAKLAFVLEISEKLNLHHKQCWDLFQNFLLEGFRGSVSQLNHLLGVENEKRLLLHQVKNYYHKERIYWLRCLKHLLGYWQDYYHPFRAVYEQALEILEFDGGQLIPGLWEEFEKWSLAEPPSTIETAEEESEWLHQKLVEECELLEILLLFYKDFQLAPSELVVRLKRCQSCGFGVKYHGRLVSNSSTLDALSKHVGYLCYLVLLETIDVVCINDDVQSRPREFGHPLLSPGAASELQDLESVLLEGDSSPYQAPLILALAVLKFLHDESSEQVRLLGDRAMRSGVFEVLHRTVSSALLSGDRPASGVCKIVIHTLLSLVITLFNEGSLGEPKVLLKIVGLTLTHTHLRLAFWEKLHDDGMMVGLRMLLAYFFRRFPEELDEIVDFLLLSAGGEYSAHCIHGVLSEGRWYCELASPASLTGLVRPGSAEGSWELLRDRAVLQQECRSLGLPGISLPAGTLGEILGECKGADAAGDEEDYVMVSWACRYSYWHLLAALLAKIQVTPGIGVDPTPHPLVHFVVKSLTLVARVLRHNWKLVPSLAFITDQVLPILMRMSSMPHPPADLIAACVECVAVMAENEPVKTWEELGKTGFAPSVLVLADKSNDIHLSPGYYCQLLNVWERARGVYPITTAVLDLLLGTLRSPEAGRVASDALLACAVFVLREVLSGGHGWRYRGAKQHNDLCHMLLKLCHVILKRKPASEEKNPFLRTLHWVTVDLLLFSGGHSLLLEVLSTGVDVVDRLTASSVSLSQPSVIVTSLKLTFSIVNLLLQIKPTESVTPLEQALASQLVSRPLPPHDSSSSSLPSSQHLVAALASYIHHRDDLEVPVGAMRLLARLASVGTLPMYSCLGQEALAIRDRFSSRLEAWSEYPVLKVAILELISALVGTQPGLLELFLSIKTPLDPSFASSLGTEGPPSSESTAASRDLVEPESCIYAIVAMASPESKDAPEVVSTAVALLRALWQGRHSSAMQAIRASGLCFWEAVTHRLFCPVVMENMAECSEEREMELSYQLSAVADTLQLVAMELYYVVQGFIDRPLENVLGKFSKENCFSTWNKALLALSYGESTRSPPETLLSAQRHLATSWRMLLVVAATHHEELFLIDSIPTRKLILDGLLEAVESQADVLPRSMAIMDQLCSVYSTLLLKWRGGLDSLSDLIARLQAVLEVACRCEHLYMWRSVIPSLFSAIVLAVRAVRESKADLETRFAVGLLAPVCSTLDSCHAYQSEKLKFPPEVLAVHLLSELTQTLPSGDPAWLDALRHAAVLTVLCRMADDHLRAQTNPEFLEAILSFFLVLAVSPEAAECLVVNRVPQVLCLSLANMAATLLDTTTSSSKPPPLHGSAVAGLTPPTEWTRVWQCGLRLNSQFLGTLGHRYVDHALNFMGANDQRISKILDLSECTRHVEAVRECQWTAALIQQMASYKRRWQFNLPQQHVTLVEKIVVLLNGSVMVLSKRTYLKRIIKTMDAQGLLPNEWSSPTASVGKRSGRHPYRQDDDDLWVLHTPAYHQLKRSLVSIATSCLTTLNHYSPPLGDLLLCSFNQAVDLSEWPPIVVFSKLNMVPVDPGSPLTLSTLTRALQLGLDLLSKLDSRRLSTTPSKSPGCLAATPPQKSPVTPATPHPSGGEGAGGAPSAQQCRCETLFMLEQIVALLMSQSLRFLLDGRVDPHDKQILRKQLAAELTSFCQNLLLSFSRKGVPSPQKPQRHSLSDSRLTLQDSSLGRSSTYSFGEDHGIFKVAELFAKRLTR